MPPPTSLAPYCWPIKPFQKAHPIRGYFNDPRISGPSRAFHFGVDISCKDGTPVYAVEAGKVHLEGARSLSVVCAGGRTFGYWHVVPAVGHHQLVKQGQVLGHVEPPWGHVHFAETFRKKYRNPLRRGALEPWVDPGSPRIVSISLLRAGTQKEVPHLNVKGLIDVVVEAFDQPPLHVPAPWSDMPVTPALLRWRVLRAGKVVRPWHSPVDFRKTLLPREVFKAIYAPGTRQNHPGTPGSYRFYLVHGWRTRLLSNGLYRLEAEAADVSGNRARAALPLTIAN